MTGAPRTGSGASSDRAAVEALLGRPPLAGFEVAVRCPYGAPAVVRNRPADARGRPFPTRDWLRCRALADAVSRLEAAGGVRMLEQDDAMREPLLAAHRRHAALHDGHRVAGGGDPGRVKCLHAHLAFAMAEGGSPGGGLDPRPRRRALARAVLPRPAWGEGGVSRSDPAVAAARFSWDEGLRRLGEPAPPTLARARHRVARRGHRRAAPARGPDVHARRPGAGLRRRPVVVPGPGRPHGAARPAAWDPAVALDAAFAAYSRQASDARL